MTVLLFRFDGSGAGDVDTSTVVELKDGKERASLSVHVLSEGLFFITAVNNFLPNPGISTVLS
jgi:hypothetical protein